MPFSSNDGKEKIPKIIHIVWIGDESRLPMDYIKTWIDYNPTWTVKIWGNDQYYNYPWRNRTAMDILWDDSKFETSRKCGIADIMRYEILYNEGGFCVDADTICIRPLEDWLFDAEACASWENETIRPGLITVAFMASIPKNKFFKSIIEEIYNDSNITDDLPWITVGPVRLTNAYNSLNYIDLKIWPSHYFIPKHYDAPEYTGDEPVFSRHEWMTTMADYEYHQKRNKQKITKSKICVYGIALNEIKHVDRFMESAKDADLVVIADTGSTDGTAERLRELGAFVFDINIKPWRFDLARNSSLALIPKDIDICVSLDLDEILQPGWRAEIERLWTLNTTRIRYKFDCGNGVIFKKEWIHSRNGYMWRHMCHENIVPTGNIPEVYVDSNMILALHSPDDSKSRGQYLNMLRSSVKEDPTCPRSSFYYARELTFNSLWRESIEEFNRYLKLPNAYWTVERSYAMKCIGKAYNHLGDIYNAEKWLYLAAAELPNARESWCELALLFYYQSRWEECFALSMKTLKITSNVAEHTADTTVWGYLPHDLASIAAWHLGIKKVAIEQAKLAVNAAPDDTRLIDNLNALLDGQNDLD